MAAQTQTASAADKTWTGAVDGAWDVTTPNWKEGQPPGGVDATYVVGDRVFFTDNFAGTNTTIFPSVDSTNAASLTFVHVPGTVSANYTFNRGGDLPAGGTTPFGANPSPGEPQVLLLDTGFLGQVNLRARGNSASNGVTIIRSGVLEINDGGALPANGAGNNNNPGNVTLAGGTLAVNINTAGNVNASSGQLAGRLIVTSNSTLANTSITTNSGPYRIWGSQNAAMVEMAPDVTLTIVPGLASARFDSNLSLAQGTFTLGTNSGFLRMGSPGLGGASATFDTGSNGGIIRAGGTTLNLGALTGAAGTRVEAQDSAGPAADTISIGGKNVDATFLGVIADGINATTPRPASVTKVGTGIQTLAGVNTLSGTTTVNAGVLRVTGSIAQSSGVTVNAGGVFDAAATQTIKALTVNGGGTARVSAAGPGFTVLKTGALTLTDSGALDVGVNAVVVDYTTEGGGGTSPLSSIRAAVAAGAAPPGGSNAPVIRSSAGFTGGAVGYAEASDALGPTGGSFLGQQVDGGAVLIRHTLAGDASLNGVVDFNDLARLAQNYNVADGTMTWSQGDFTHDGNVDFNDLAAMAQNYNTSLPTPALGGFSPEFSADVQAAFAAVPEPGTGGAICVVALGAVVRRRRRGGERGIAERHQR
jgi:autotransporter-associated beta strand protein